MSKKTPNPVDIHIGSKVRERRMLIGMSQEKLGEELGLTFQQVQKYEKGANRIGGSRLHHISKVLGVRVDWFFPDRDENLTTGPTLDQRDAALLRAYHQLSPGQQERLKAFLKSITALQEAA